MTAEEGRNPELGNIVMECTGVSRGINGTDLYFMGDVQDRRGRFVKMHFPDGEWFPVVRYGDKVKVSLELLESAY